MQREDEIKIGLLDLATRRKEQEARYVKLRTQVSEQEGYLQNLGSASLRSDFDGVVWRNNIVEGSNVLVGTDPQRILREANSILDGNTRQCTIPENWDGRAAERIVEVLLNVSREKGSAVYA